MMMIGILAIALAAVLDGGAMSEAEKAAYEQEAADLAMRWRAEANCRDMPRLPNETVEACTERRLAAIAASGNAGFYSISPFRAGEARQRCDNGEQQAGEAPGACITRVMAAIEQEDDLFADVAPAPPPSQAAPAAATTRCEHKVRNRADEQETSLRVTFGCTNGDTNAAEEALDRLFDSE